MFAYSIIKLIKRIKIKKGFVFLTCLSIALQTPLHFYFEAQKPPSFSIQFQNSAHANERPSSESSETNETLESFFSEFRNANNTVDIYYHLGRFFSFLEKQLKNLSVTDPFDFHPLIQEIFEKGLKVRIVRRGDRVIFIISSRNDPLEEIEYIENHKGLFSLDRDSDLLKDPEEIHSRIQSVSQTLNSLYNEALRMSQLLKASKGFDSPSEIEKRITEMQSEYSNRESFREQARLFVEVTVELSMMDSTEVEWMRRFGSNVPLLSFHTSFSFKRLKWFRKLREGIGMPMPENIERVFKINTDTLTSSVETVKPERIPMTDSISITVTSGNGRDIFISLLSRLRKTLIFASTQFSHGRSIRNGNLNTGYAWFTDQYRSYQELLALELHQNLLNSHKDFIRQNFGEINQYFLQNLFQSSLNFVKKMAEVVELQEQLLLDNRFTPETGGRQRRTQIIDRIFDLAPASGGRLILHLLQISPEPLAEIVWDSTNHSNQDLSARYREMATRVKPNISGFSFSFPESIEAFSGQSNPERARIVQEIAYLFTRMSGNTLYDIFLQTVDHERFRESVGQETVVRVLRGHAKRLGPIRSAYLAVEIANLERLKDPGSEQHRISEMNENEFLKEVPKQHERQESRNRNGISDLFMQEVRSQMGHSGLRHLGLGHLTKTTALFYFGIITLAFAQFQFSQSDHLYTGHFLLQSLASPEGLISFIAFMIVSSTVTNGLQFSTLKLFYSNLLKYQSQRGAFPLRVQGRILRPRFFTGFQFVGLVAGSLAAHLTYSFLSNPEIKRCVQELFSGSWGNECQNAKAAFTSRAESSRFIGGTVALVFSASATHLAFSGLKFVAKSEAARRIRGLGGILRTYETTFRAMTSTTSRVTQSLKNISLQILYIVAFLYILDLVYDPVTNFVVEWTYAGVLEEAKQEFERALNSYKENLPHSGLRLAISLVGLRESYKHYRTQSFLHSYNMNKSLYDNIQLTHNILFNSSKKFYKEWLLNKNLILNQNDLNYDGSAPLIRTGVFNSGLPYSEYDLISYLLIGQVCGKEIGEIKSSLEEIKKEDFFHSPPTFIPFRTVNEFYTGADERQRRVDVICKPPIYPFTTILLEEKNVLLPIHMDFSPREKNHFLLNDTYYDDNYNHDGLLASGVRATSNFFWPPLKYSEARFQFVPRELTTAPLPQEFTFPEWIQVNFNEELQNNITSVTKDSILRQKAHTYVLERVFNSNNISMNTNYDSFRQDLRKSASKRQKLTNIVSTYLQDLTNIMPTYLQDLTNIMPTYLQDLLNNRPRIEQAMKGIDYYCNLEPEVADDCKTLPHFLSYVQMPTTLSENFPLTAAQIQTNLFNHPLHPLYLDALDVIRMAYFDHASVEDQNEIKFESWWSEQFHEIKYQNLYKSRQTVQQIVRENFIPNYNSQENWLTGIRSAIGFQTDIRTSIKEEVVAYNEVLSVIKNKITAYGYDSCNESNRERDYFGYIDIEEVKLPGHFESFEDIENTQTANKELVNKKIKHYLLCIIDKHKQQRPEGHSKAQIFIRGIEIVLKKLLKDEEEMTYGNVFYEEAPSPELLYRDWENATSAAANEDPYHQVPTSDQHIRTVTPRTISEYNTTTLVELNESLTDKEHDVILAHLLLYSESDSDNGILSLLFREIHDMLETLKFMQTKKIDIPTPLTAIDWSDVSD